MVNVNKLKLLLNQAIHETFADANAKGVRTLIQEALIKLDKIPKKGKAKTETNQWWNSVIAGTTKMAQANNQTFSTITQQKTLAQLNAMIAEEQHKLDELEKEEDEELLSE